MCDDCKVQQNPRLTCRDNRKPRHELQDDLPGQEYSPESGRPTYRPAKEFTQASESVFWYPDAMGLESRDEEDKQALREETPTETKQGCAKAKAATTQKAEASWLSTLQEGPE
jgi:hypothetical protein